MIAKSSAHVLFTVFLKLLICPQFTILAKDHVIDKLLENVIQESKQLIEKPVLSEPFKSSFNANLILDAPLNDAYKQYQLLSAQILSSGNHIDPSDYEKLKSHSEQFFNGPLGEGLVYHMHQVKPGEYLTSIARKYEITVDRILAFNPDLKPDKMFPGQTLKKVKGPNSILISKSNFKLHLFIRALYYQSFPIGIGHEGSSTPEMKTTISNSRAKFPTYTNPETKITYPYGHPDNPIGTRWLGLSVGKGYGIHGTNDESSIGKAMSHGCIRMKKDDLEWAYNLILEGDEVEIRP